MGQKRSNYPWQSWADGNVRCAVRGEHFTVTSVQFLTNGRNWARRNGYTWRADILADRPDEVRFTLRRTPL